MTEPLPIATDTLTALHAPDALKMILASKSSLIAGPGIGVSDDTKRLVEWLIAEACEPSRPLLLDADGLNALAELGCETRSVRAARSCSRLIRAKPRGCSASAPRLSQRSNFGRAQLASERAIGTDQGAIARYRVADGSPYSIVVDNRGADAEQPARLRPDEA